MIELKDFLLLLQELEKHEFEIVRDPFAVENLSPEWRESIAVIAEAGYIAILRKNECRIWVSANYMPLWRGSVEESLEEGRGLIAVWNMEDCAEFTKYANVITHVCRKLNLKVKVCDDPSGF